MSESNYVGFGAFVLGIIAGIFMATVDPLKVLSDALIYVLKMLWITFNQQYPGAYPSSMHFMFAITISLLAVFPVLSFLSDLAKIVSYGVLNLAAFVFGIITGFFMFSNQGLSMLFAFLGIVSAFFVEAIVRG